MRPCFAGCDLSLSDDLTSVCFAWPRLPGETPDDWPRVYLTHKFYLPEDVIFERERECKVPLRLWAEQGWITLTEGNVIDHAVVRRDILDMNERQLVRQVAFDPSFGTETMVLLASSGLDVRQFNQNRREMSAALKECRELIMLGQLGHEENPVTAWHVGNTQMKVDTGGRYYPIKSEGTGARSARRRHKIDGVFAMLMAIHCALSEEVQESVYASRGIQSL
jgi:phage terminase large subunit-like protein